VKKQGTRGQGDKGAGTEWAVDREQGTGDRGQGTGNKGTRDVCTANGVMEG